MKCPGQDNRNWKPEDVFEVPCPACGASIEFFKIDTSRRCHRCGYRFKNPRLDLGCAQWCPAARECLASLGGFSANAETPPPRNSCASTPPKTNRLGS